MRTEQILTEAFQSGVLVYVKGEELAFRVKKGQLPDDIKKRLKDNKAEIIQYLTNIQLEQAVPSKDGIELVPRDPAERIPLSYAQKRLWFIAQLESADAPYHIAEALRLNGQLSVQALEDALRTIVSRHEILRTVFYEEDGEPWQRVRPEGQFALLHKDFSHLSEPAQAAAVAAEVEAEATAPFDLQEGPLFRGRLLHLANDQHVLLVTMHHIVSDGWSMGLLIHEINTLYRAYQASIPNPLAPLEIQYGDYAAWQRRCLTGETLEREEAYWKSHLDGAPSLLELPADWPRPAVQSFRGASVEVTLGRDLSDRVKALASAEGLTLHMVLFAAWAVVLARLSGQDQIVIGTPVSNRQRRQLEDLIGFFVNTLALKANLSGEPTVRELLVRVKEFMLAGYSHQDIPFERIVEVIQPVRSLNHSPIFQAVFSFDPEADSALDLSGLQLDTLEAESVSAQFDLNLSLDDNEEGISGALGYATDLFDRGTVERWSLYFARIVEGFVRRPNTLVHCIDMLPEVERNRLLVEFNQTRTAYPEQALIHQVFESQVTKSPDSIALVYEDRAISYGELNERANRLAHELIARGVKPDTLVGLCVERSPEMMVGILAVLKAGGAYVPLDPGYPEARLAFQLKDAGLDIVLTQQALLATIPVTKEQALCLDDSTLFDVLASRPSDNPDPVQLGINSKHLAYVIYTSGTTGQPKGSLLTHTGLVNLALALTKHCKANRNSKILQFASIAFDASVFEWVMAFGSGASLVVPSHALLCKDALQLTQLVKQNGVTHATLPPSLLPLLDREDWKSVDVLVVAGESCPIEQAKIWSEGRTLINGYGPSEASVCSSMKIYEGVFEQWTIGTPLQNIQHYVVDQALQPVPQGVVGELLIGGVGLARGYLGRPDLTAAKFIQNPFIDDADARLYRTGDLVRHLVDGEMEYVGRVDHQVKLRGLRIELGEIETHLRAHPAVREAVLLLDTAPSGDGRIVAYVTATEGSDIRWEGLREHLRTRLPDYMVPAAFVVLQSLPLTLSGKIDRKALPAPDLNSLTQKHEAPLGTTERALAEIWRSLLGLQKVGRWDNFFELGGHSLLVIQLIARLQAEQLNVDVRAVFDAPVLKDLAERIEQNPTQQFKAPANLIPDPCHRITPELLPLIALDQDEIDLIVRLIPGSAANIQDIYPLAPLQEGILFHHMLSSPEHGDTYIMPTLLAVRNREQLDKLIGALNAVIARHDVLRTAVLWEGLPRAVQVVLRKAELMVTEVALPTGGDALSELRERIEPEHLWMDLRQAPLVQVEITATPDSDQYFVAINIHHIAIDHIGLEILMEELDEHLQARAFLQPPPVPYREFVAHTLALAESGDMEDYFRSRLGDIDEPTLPFGIDDILVTPGQIRESSRVIDATLAMKVRLHSQRLGISAASFFHLAWALVVGRCSGRDDVVFGTILSGRLQGTAGADRTLGLFINTLPIRLSLAGSVQACLQQAQSELLALLKYEQASLFAVHACTSLPNDTPLFTSSLNYRKDLSLGDDGEQSAHRGFEPMPMDDDIVDLEQGQERTNYPIGIAVNDDDHSGGFELVAQAVRPLDPERLIDYLQGALTRMVDALERAPEQPLYEIDLLPSGERNRLLIDYNQTQTEYPQERLIHQIFEGRAASHPDAVALCYEERLLSYGELNKRANRLARELVERGVKPDTLVGLCMERSLEMMIGILAVLKAGGAYVPLDPDYPKARLAYQLEDADLDIVLTQRALLSTLPVANEQALCLDDAALQERLTRQPDDNLDPASLGLNAQHLAYVIYTSGTTGQPKGSLLTHTGLVNLSLGLIDSCKIDSRSTLLQFASIAFDASVTEWSPALCSGARLVIPSSSSLCKDAGRLTALVQQAEVTHAILPPSLLSVLNSEDWQSVKVLLVVGESCPLQQAQHWAAGRTLINGYGPSEATAGTSLKNYDGEVQRITIGKPIQNVQCYIVDQSLQPVPEGVVGELLIGGVGLGRGYLKQPELTVEKFIDNPFSDDPASRVYRTGDLVRYLPDGDLDYIGRIDQQVKLRGVRIELSEIETLLCAHPAVREAVLVLDHSSSGDGRLLAYVSAANPSSEIEPDSLRESLRTHLPDYMLPAAFTVLDSLPLTLTGKVDRSALPAPDLSSLTRQYEPPVGETEVVLASIWQELLDVERVGRNDNFFNIGGNSLTALRLIGLLAAEGYRLPLTALYENETIATISHYIDSEQRELSNPVALNSCPDDQTRPLFLTHEITGELFYYKQLAKELEPHFPVYGLQLTGMQIPLYGLSVKSLAAEYIERMKEVQPTGPYRVAGWSSGGSIAYEIAYQLLGLEDQVEFVGLIDCGFDLSSENDALAFDAIEELNRDTEDAFGIEVDISLLKAFVDTTQEGPLLAPSRIPEMRSAPEVAALFDKLRNAGLEERTVLERINVFHALALVTKRYSYPALPVDVHLFYAPDPNDAAPGNRFERFGNVLGDRIKSVLIGGTHETIVRLPLVSVLAKNIVDVVDAEQSLNANNESTYSPLVHIQNGHANRVPLICIPGAGESATCFLDLVRSLAPEIPVVALQPKGLDVTTVPHVSVEHAADFYASAVKSKWPNGPYCVLGHSFGGWIAHELIGRLNTEGADSGALVLLDSQHPALCQATAPQKTRTDYLLELSEIWAQTYDREISIKREQLMAMDKDTQLQLLLDTLNEAKERKGDINIQTLRTIVDAFIVNASTVYIPTRRYSGPTLLVNALHKGQYDEVSAADATAAWRHTLPNLQELDVAGNHMSLLKTPLTNHVGQAIRTLWQQMNECAMQKQGV